MAKGFIPALIVSVLIACPTAWADGYDDAYTAYRRTDYATALELVRPLAEQGDPRAQYLLSLMYALGRGVEKDDCTGSLWMDKAGRQGYSQAYHHMAWVHFSGLGVPRNDVLAYRWALAAVRSGDAFAKQDLDMFGSGLSDAQRKRIESTMQIWSPTDQEPLQIRRLPNNPYGRILESLTGIRRCNIDD